MIEYKQIVSIFCYFWSIAMSLLVHQVAILIEQIFG